MNTRDTQIYEDIMKRIPTEEVYLRYDFENVFVKSIPKKGYWLKFKGEEEFEVPHDHRIVTEALLEYSEISKKKYISA
jgi:hypothetical protein